MFLPIYLALLALFVSQTSAWFPEEQKHIFSADGKNLFSPNGTADGNTTSKRWLQASGKIRGVNLGSLFVFEPWLAGTEWSNMGCGASLSEFDCVTALGQDQANAVFQNHWNTWITKNDITQMQSYGLNTIRIPVGYWMMESIVYTDSEHFPQGGLNFLEQVCGWASDAGFYIIIDMHGAPGAQVAQNPDTGQVSYISVLTIQFFGSYIDMELRTDFSRMPLLLVSTLTINTTVQPSSSPGKQSNSDPVPIPV